MNISGKGVDSGRCSVDKEGRAGACCGKTDAGKLEEVMGRDYVYDPDEGEFVDFETLEEWSERDAAKDKLIAQLRAELQAEREHAGRLASALEYIDDYCLSYPDLGALSGVARPAIKEHDERRK